MGHDQQYTTKNVPEKVQQTLNQQHKEDQDIPLPSIETELEKQPPASMPNLPLDCSFPTQQPSQRHSGSMTSNTPLEDQERQIPQPDLHGHPLSTSSETASPVRAVESTRRVWTPEQSLSHRVRCCLQWFRRDDRNFAQKLSSLRAASAIQKELTGHGFQITEEAVRTGEVEPDED